ncbi:MAG: EAL domain-containing protein [Methylomonas sp.]|nr:EAL domain-containing protein [Methylomonas sp.]
MKLEPIDMAALLDIHDILMTWNTDESTVLQKLCDKLLAALHAPLIWGGLINQDHKLTVFGAAGNEADRIKGLVLDCSDTLANHPAIKDCIDTLTPASLPGGLIELNSRLFENLPRDVRTLQTDIYPLTLENRCMGILAVATGNKQNTKHHSLLQLAAQHAGFALGMLRNFVAKEHAQSSLKLAAAVFDHSLEGIFITDTTGSILAANDAASRITGYKPEELLGQNPRIFKSGRHGQDFYRALWHSVYRHKQWEGEIWNKRKNGEIFPEWLSISAILDEHTQLQNYICIFIDISKQKEAEARLNYLAYHDKLTGLPNRDLFHDRLNASILRAKRNQTDIAVLFIDIDHFKYINDTFGHAKGDLLLQKVANKLKGCLRENDTLARMGGDEFTVILEDFAFQADVELTAGRILKAFNQPVYLDNQELYVSVSIGISFYPEDANNPSMLMKHADTAMYSAKNSGRKCLHFFRSTMESYSIQRIEMEQQLRHALDNHEFRLFYQPQFNLETSAIDGAEALIRWQHPQKGLIAPDKFIPMAEDTGMIVPIGEWVLKQAWAECQNWHRAGHALRVGVNLSAHQFNHAHLTELASMVLNDAIIDASFLELELTESLVMRQVEDTLAALNTLKKSGIRLAIDDFGTGYSSLSYLKQFPIDRLKIDRSFVGDLANNPNDAAIVVAIIAMAHCMGLEVIAEGVETEEQLKFLRMHDCNQVQGYLTGKPLPANEFLLLLASKPQLSAGKTHRGKSKNSTVPAAHPIAE